MDSDQVVAHCSAVTSQAIAVHVTPWPVLCSSKSLEQQVAQENAAGHSGLSHNLPAVHVCQFIFFQRNAVPLNAVRMTAVETPNRLIILILGFCQFMHTDLQES